MLICRFYVEDYRLLTDHITVEQYYFQAKQGICYVSIITYMCIYCTVQNFHGTNFHEFHEKIAVHESISTSPYISTWITYLKLNMKIFFSQKLGNKNFVLYSLCLVFILFNAQQCHTAQ